MILKILPPLEVNRQTEIDEGGSTTAAGNHDVGFWMRNMSREETVTETLDAGSSRKKLRRHRVAGYLDMGWYSARCLWTQYLNAVDGQEVLAVREKIMRFATFWTAVVGVSIAFLWCAFGCFHELFCIGVIEPPITYAKDVNKYLTIVPPHVVVTNKGKMFQYRPTAEERFIWSSAKKISNFKI
ncbi:Hypothetical protein CINCED_3A024673 [Cinara cedri]|uniref:Uncharacterized protein n=1 Tax=Cinara cedri TaxID=506608 RepID=A0A5E4NB60_9HEMI|nr:Hypothetical protein CINCED_3A024673 [Cinara cedri]